MGDICYLGYWSGLKVVNEQLQGVLHVCRAVKMCADGVSSVDGRFSVGTAEKVKCFSL